MKKIKVKEILSGSHSLMNDVVIHTAGLIEDAEIVIKIDDLLKDRNVTQKDLAQMTGMRVGTVSEIVNGKGISFNKVQLLSIMVALRITDFSEIFELRLPEDTKEHFIEQSKEWINDKEMPIEVKEMYKENVLKATGLA